MRETDVLIIGGGLTSLTLQYLLKGSGYAVRIVEARDRLGGRIWTKTTPNQARIDMGATWLGQKHHRLIRLLQELQLPVFPQQLGKEALFEQDNDALVQRVPLPPNDDPSYRIQGGTSALIQALSQHIPTDQVYLNSPVRSIRLDNGSVKTVSEQLTFESKVVVSTLPPNLLSHRIELQPALPDALTQLMHQTHTWMGESIKAGLTYAQPFWREAGRAGTAFSQVGPFTELYDHADATGTNFALKGFLREDLAHHGQTERKHRVLAQMQKLYGQSATDFIRYEETVWPEEPYTYAPYKQPVIPHQNNGHAAYRQPLWNGRLFLAGSETAAAYPGYMEGAVRSAEWVYQELIKSHAL